MRLCIKYVDSFTSMYILPKTAKRFLPFQLSLLLLVPLKFKMQAKFSISRHLACQLSLLVSPSSVFVYNSSNYISRWSQF
jgi:hypothetical protein